MSADEKMLLQIIRKIADYQFGRGAGKRLFPEDVIVKVSKRTGGLGRYGMVKR